MVHGNLLEALRGKRVYARSALEQELPLWEKLMFEYFCQNAKGLPSNGDPEILEALASFEAMGFNRFMKQRVFGLPILRKVLGMSQVSPLDLMQTLYTPAGLYATPVYLTD